MTHKNADKLSKMTADCKAKVAAANKERIEKVEAATKEFNQKLAQNSQECNAKV